MHKVVYVLDASGSMSHRVKDTVQLTLDSIAKLNSNDRVTILTFESHTVRMVVNDVEASKVRFRPQDYRIGGMTNLIDAVMEGIDKGGKGKKNTRLIVVLTDGGENSSTKYRAAQLAAKMRELILTDHWTFAWMVPPENVEEAVALGVDRSNILGWTDIKVAGQALQAGTQTMQDALTRGETSLKRGFFTDLSGVKKKDIRKQARLLKQDEYTILDVDKKESIKTFALRRFGEFVKGEYLYQLVNREKVQKYKEVAIIDTRRPHEVFIGGRTIVGLPYEDKPVNPGDHGNYEIYVQSTSFNRATDPGTKMLRVKGLKINK